MTPGRVSKHVARRPLEVTVTTVGAYVSAMRALVPALALALPLLQAPSAQAAPSQNWYQYHGDGLHAGYSPSTPRPTAPKAVWKARLDGVVQASPLVIGSTVIAATESNTIYGLSRHSGQLLWKRHLGAPVPQSSLPCGNITPNVGITGTPVYDKEHNRVFAVTTTRVAGRVRHTLVGVSAATGALQVSSAIDPAGQDTSVQNQRGALNLTHGRVLITYGGHSGDCGSYHGYLVSVLTNGTDARYYRTGTQGEAGMWQASGPAVDARGFAYVVTGNGRATSGAWDGGNSVQVVNAFTAKLHDYFAESSWAQGNADDTDLGSSGALVFGGGTRIWIQGKTNVGYVLDAAHLGGIGHPLQTVTDACARQFGGPASLGSFLVLPCTDGLRLLRVQPDNSVALSWKAPSSITGSPVIGGGVVWSLDPGAGTLHGLDLSSGASRYAIAVGATVRFATPALSGTMAYVPTTSGITAVGGV
ncbi:MAG: hypothetical protein JWL79_1880 [Frankiales bacterium]|nr:hypothetical protein [Frankiales bacterium]